MVKPSERGALVHLPLPIYLKQQASLSVFLKVLLGAGDTGALLASHMQIIRVWHKFLHRSHSSRFLED